MEPETLSLSVCQLPAVTFASILPQAPVCPAGMSPFFSRRRLPPPSYEEDVERRRVRVARDHAAAEAGLRVPELRDLHARLHRLIRPRRGAGDRIARAVRASIDGAAVADDGPGSADRRPAERVAVLEVVAERVARAGVAGRCRRRAAALPPDPPSAPPPRRRAPPAPAAPPLPPAARAACAGGAGVGFRRRHARARHADVARPRSRRPPRSSSGRPRPTPRTCTRRTTRARP